MNVAEPHTAICPTLDSGVLSVLAGTTRPLTGREVARLMGRNSHSGVLDVLTRLSEHGLVDRQEAGRALLYTLNRDHLAAPAVSILAGIRGELLDRLRERIGGWELQPLHASLFGSVARRDGDVDSDIDLFIVRPIRLSDEDSRWRGQINDLAGSVQRWTGNRAGIAEVAEAEINRLSQGETPIVNELRSDAIVLTGPDIVALFGTPP
jgi:DNA-binding transcriptional ArsR family regulator